MHSNDQPSRPFDPEANKPGVSNEAAPSTVQRLPAELDNWQVWDIDGATTEINELIDADEAPRIPDRQDDVLVAALAQRHWQVEPGNSLALPVTVLNNSTRRLTVRIYLEGWLDDRWVAEPYVQANLAPGERRTLELTIAPPRHASVEAGDYHVAVVVRTPDEPMRAARLGVVLAILPFDRIVLDPTDFPASPAAWWRRTLPLPVRVANEGNRSLVLRLEGAAALQAGRITATSKEATDRKATDRKATDSDSEQGEPFTLRPGEQRRVPMRLTLCRLPLVALHRCSLPFVLRATAADDGRVLQQMRGEIEVRPIIGAWQIVSLFGLAMAGVIATALIVVLGALFLRVGANEAHSSAPVVAPAPAIIVVTLNQPVAPTSGVGASLTDGGAETRSSAGVGQPDPALPLVLPDQITSPGSGGPMRSLAPPPAATSNDGAPAASTLARPMTYAQMFQSVAIEHDLDWRMLAAQAYVESGFDALALSSAGAMGLMQVLPGTWREWAPAVGASDPFDSYSNVQVAAVYLDYLRGQLAQRGYTEKEWMLVAYHWGIDRLNGFLAEGGAWQDLPEARRRYAEDILRIAQTLP